jgi:adenylosuccinate synthase
MKADIVIGMQWGDEGKGKIVDLIASEYDAIVRANGGNNAGHSISINGKNFAVHSLPSGVLQKNKVNLIGAGCVVNPRAIIKEIEKLGTDFKGSLYISNRCPIVLDKYIEEDKEKELKKGEKAIVTTLKGIGPTYAALKNRETFLIGDLLNIEESLNKYILSDKESITKELEEYKELLKDYICDGMDIIKQQKNILIEGSQATMLDNNYGTYPFVTSSTTIVSGLLAGCGLNHTNVRNVVGVMKAYCTRVGNGIFLTEDLGEAGEKIRTIGKEIGVSTGRPRRCGWIDLVQLKYAIQLNGINQLAIMKSDVLDTFDKIKVCVAYEDKLSCNKIDYVPYNLEHYKPVYIELDGWKENTYKINDYNLLPIKLKTYLDFISESVGVQIKYISTGPERESTIELEENEFFGVTFRKETAIEVAEYLNISDFMKE